MSRPRVMVVEANDARRDVFCAYLSSRFEVVPFPLVRKAIAAFDSIEPDAVIAHVRQPGSSGLELVKALRTHPAGDRALMVVYGHPVGPRPTPDKAEKLRQDAGADVYLCREVDEVDLERVLGLALVAPVEAPDVPLPTDAELRFVSAQREAPEEDEGDWGSVLGEGGDQKQRLLDSIRRRYGGIIDKLPKDRDVSWGEVLRARATLHNIGVLLDKPVTPLIQRLPQGKRPSLEEALRARATLRNLKVILKQGVGGNDPEEDGAG